MTRNLVIIGCGGFGQEVAAVVDAITAATLAEPLTVRSSGGGFGRLESYLSDKLSAAIASQAMALPREERND